MVGLAVSNGSTVPPPPAPSARVRPYHITRFVRARLALSHSTVQNHVQNTLGKLHLHNRIELVRYAIEHGLADEPEGYS
jgi:hypothetical protein